MNETLYRLPAHVQESLIDALSVKLVPNYSLRMRQQYRLVKLWESDLKFEVSGSESGVVRGVVETSIYFLNWILSCTINFAITITGFTETTSQTICCRTRFFPLTGQSSVSFHVHSATTLICLIVSLVQLARL